MGVVRRIQDRRGKVQEKLGSDYAFIRPRYMREGKFEKLCARHFDLTEDLKRECLVNAVRAMPQVLTTHEESVAWRDTVMAALESDTACILKKDRITLPSARANVWEMVKSYTETKGRERIQAAQDSAYASQPVRTVIRADVKRAI